MNDAKRCTEYPSQSKLERAVTEKFPAERVEKLLNHIRTVGASFDEIIKRYGLDVIIAPGDSDLTAFSAALGNPSFPSYFDRISLFLYIS